MVELAIFSVTDWRGLLRQVQASEPTLESGICKSIKVFYVGNNCCSSFIKSALECAAIEAEGPCAMPPCTTKCWKVSLYLQGGSRLCGGAPAADTQPLSTETCLPMTLSHCGMAERGLSPKRGVKISSILF